MPNHHDVSNLTAFCARRRTRWVVECRPRDSALIHMCAACIAQASSNALLRDKVEAQLKPSTHDLDKFPKDRTRVRGPCWESWMRYAGKRQRMETDVEFWPGLQTGSFVSIGRPWSVMAPRLDLLSTVSPLPLYYRLSITSTTEELHASRV